MNGGCSDVSNSSDDEEYIPTGIWRLYCISILAEIEGESSEGSEDDLSE